MGGLTSLKEMGTGVLILPSGNVGYSMDESRNYYSVASLLSQYFTIATLILAKSAKFYQNEPSMFL